MTEFSADNDAGCGYHGGRGGYRLKLRLLRTEYMIVAILHCVDSDVYFRLLRVLQVYGVKELYCFFGPPTKICLRLRKTRRYDEGSLPKLGHAWSCGRHEQNEETRDPRY